MRIKKSRQKVWKSSLSLYFKIPQFIRGYLPFLTYDVVRRKMRKDTKTILDICCGSGQYANLMKRNNHIKMVGIDAFLPDVERARATGYYERVIQGDITKYKFESKSFDVVLLIYALEHLSKDEGMKILNELERIAKKQIILSTNSDFFQQEPFVEHKGEEKNPFQKHKSGYWGSELLRRGYKLNGMDGWRGFRKNDNKKGLKGNNPITYSTFLFLNALSQLATYFYWKQATLIIGTKNLSK